MKSFLARSLLLAAAALSIPACGKDRDSSSGGGGAPPPGGPPPAGVLPAPTNIVATPQDRQITLTWDAVAGATGYTIRSATDQGGPYGLVEHNFPGTLFIDDTLDNGTTYYYVITTVNSAGEGPQSPEVSATPFSSGPGPSTWTKSASNPVFTASPVPTDWDAGGVGSASVVRVGATWVMYYTGRASNFGAYAIGQATSSDGIAWTRTGAAPVLPAGNVGSWDSVSVSDPHVVFDGASYKMWYSGDSGGASQIGYASSTDGLTWMRSASPVLAAGTAGSWDAFSVSEPGVLFEGGTYQMWYTGADTTGNLAVSQVGYATSTDGITWSKYPAPVLPPSAGTFDARMTRDLMVLRVGGTLNAWYSGGSGVGGGLTFRILHATSTDGINWTKQPSGSPQPVLSVGPAGSWDERDVLAPFVAVDGAMLRMWYTGNNSASATTSIGTATSVP